MLPRLAPDSAVCQKQKNCAEDRSNEPCTLAPRIDVEATSKKTRYECTGDANARCDQTPSRIRAGRKHLGNNTDHKPNQQCPKNVHDSFDRNCLDLSTKKTFFGLACISIFHFTPNAMKDTLKLLVTEARNYAEFSMRNIGHVPPTMLAMTPEGTLTFLPDGLEDEKAKTSFANTARMICAGYGATAVVMILESWATFAKNGKRLDDTPPSEAMDRKEFVVLMGETTGRKTTEFMPILRTDAGGFFGFGEFDSSGLEGFQGRFTEMLPPIKPDGQMREMVRLLLQKMGVTKNLLQPKPGRN